jgi:hypothetical protein
MTPNPLTYQPQEFPRTKLPFAQMIGCSEVTLDTLTILYPTLINCN